MAYEKISVMIIDDSASVRAAFASLLKGDPGIDLTATASDPFEAAALMKTSLPDVLLLDLHMPKMDGLTFLKKIMKQRPMPVVVISSFAQEGSEATMRALEYGATEVLLKPRISSNEERTEAATRLSDVIRAAAHTSHGGRPKKSRVASAPGPKHKADVVLPRSLAMPPRNAPPMIAIGASTGGTEALKVLFDGLPAGLPPIAVVQHMPEGFTQAFADRLNRSSSVHIREAAQGMIVQQGEAVIARGNMHLILHRDTRGLRCELKEGQAVSRHRPSVDVLFRSAAQIGGATALGVILTGMGDDGADGLGEMRDTGAHTIAQDEATSVVFGMPRVAIERGAAQKVAPIHDIANLIQKWSQGTAQKVAL